MAILPTVVPDTVPTEADARLAKDSSRRLAEIMSGRGADHLRLSVQPEGEPEETIAIPLPAFRLLTDILAEMARGNAVAITPIHAELSTQEAADLLNVSRPFLIDLLEKGAIPFHKVGTHRRVLFKDLMAYKQKWLQDRLKVLEELTAQAQELNMGY